MNKKACKWIFFLMISLLGASLACGIESLPAFRATENVNPNLGFCGNDLVLSNEYIITCNEQDGIVLNSFTGSYFNNSDNYIDSVDFIIIFRKYGTENRGYCHDLLGVDIPPGKTDLISCTFTSDQCFNDATVSVYSDECDYDYDKTFGFEPVEEPEAIQEVVEPSVPPDATEDQPTIEEVFKVVQPDINKIRMEWPDVLKQYPCEPDQAMQKIRDWVDENIDDWLQGPIQLVGPDMSWETVESYKEWLINNALDENREETTLLFSGDLKMDNAPTKACQTCAPPSFESWINFTVNLETCTITGKLWGRGVGDGIKSECENEENECNVYADISFSGEIIGSVDPAGALTLDPIDITSTWQATYANCKNQTDGTKSGTGSGIVNIFGEINWEMKWAKGRGEMGTGNCELSGPWDAYTLD